MQVAFGHVQASAQQLVSQLGAGKLLKDKSSLVTICNGDVSTASVFDGKLGQPEIVKLLAGYSGGKKCRQSAQHVSFSFHAFVLFFAHG